MTTLGPDAFPRGREADPRLAERVDRSVELERSAKEREAQVLARLPAAPDHVTAEQVAAQARLKGVAVIAALNALCERGLAERVGVGRYQRRA